jgi:predicted O-methyltransferase YrrM
MQNGALAVWEDVFAFLVSSGLPETLLRDMCVSPDEAARMHNLIVEVQAKRILEVGTFVGLSTALLAMEVGRDGSVVACDLDLPVPLQARDTRYVERFGEIATIREPHSALFYVRSVLDEFGVSDRVQLLAGCFSCPPQGEFAEQIRRFGLDIDCMPVVGAAAAAGNPYDLVFIDGDHYAPSVYSDLSLCHQFPEPARTIVLHDVGGGWGREVRAGIDCFLRENPAYSLSLSENVGLLQRS